MQNDETSHRGDGEKNDDLAMAEFLWKDCQKFSSVVVEAERAAMH